MCSHHGQLLREHILNKGFCAEAVLPKEGSVTKARACCLWRQHCSLPGQAGVCYLLVLTVLEPGWAELMARLVFQASSFWLSEGHVASGVFQYCLTEETCWVGIPRESCQFLVWISTCVHKAPVETAAQDLYRIGHSSLNVACTLLKSWLSMTRIWDLWGECVRGFSPASAYLPVCLCSSDKVVLSVSGFCPSDVSTPPQTVLGARSLFLNYIVKLIYFSCALNGGKILCT